MPRTYAEAQAAIDAQMAHGPQFPTGTCQMQCHNVYGIPSDGTPDATTGWARSRDRHPSTDSHATPVGAFNHWVGGSHGHGHITIKHQKPNRDNSTDGPNGRNGYWNLIDPYTVTTVWGLRYVGWSWDIDGVSVKPPNTPVRKHPHIRTAIKATRIALARNHAGTRQHLATALSELLRALGGQKK